MYINKKKFKEFIKSVLWLLAVIIFCVLLWKNCVDIGLEEKNVVHEFSTVEYYVGTSPENHRVKVLLPREVVYRYIQIQ